MKERLLLDKISKNKSLKYKNFIKDSIIFVQKKRLYEDYLDKKKAFVAANKKLKEKLVELNEVNQKLESHRKEVGVLKKEKVEQTIKEKKKEVETKLKTGKKLTTDDLLILQRK